MEKVNELNGFEKIEAVKMVHDFCNESGHYYYFKFLTKQGNEVKIRLTVSKLCKDFKLKITTSETDTKESCLKTEEILLKAKEIIDKKNQLKSLLEKEEKGIYIGYETIMFYLENEDKLRESRLLRYV